MTATKKSFSFRRQWLDAINIISDEKLRREIISIIVNYGFTGQLTTSASDVVNAMVSLIISQIPRKRDTVDENAATGHTAQAGEENSRTQHTADTSNGNIPRAYTPPHIGQPAIRAQKKGKLTTSHRYNPVPLLRSRPGGVPGELVV